MGRRGLAEGTGNILDSIIDVCLPKHLRVFHRMATTGIAVGESYFASATPDEFMRRMVLRNFVNGVMSSVPRNIGAPTTKQKKQLLQLARERNELVKPMDP